MIAGATDGYISSGGTWSGTALGGMEAMAFAAVGGAFGEDPQGTELFERSVSEGLLGGAFTLAGGGSFSDGFLGAFTSSELSSEIGKIGGDRNDLSYYSPLNEAARVAVSAIVGGSVSRLTGGSFGDAAVAAAFQRLFNDDHEHKRQQELSVKITDPNITKSNGVRMEHRDFELKYPSEKGGIIVQHITIDAGSYGHFDYWEAWKVDAGDTLVVDHANKPFDDTFAGPAGTTIVASARFYEGVEMPKSFVATDTLPSALRPATTVDPKLPTANATAPWVERWHNP